MPFVARALAGGLSQLLAGALIWAAACTGAWAATASYDILLDVDNDPATGCTVALPAPHGSFAGAERVLSTTIVTDAGGATVTGVTSRSCVGGVLAAPATVSAGGWPVGLGVGTSASAVVETFLPLAQLGGATRVRAAVMSTTPDGGDALLGADLVVGAAAPPSPGSVTPIPTLSPLWVALLAASIGLAGARLARRAGAPLAVLCACVLLSAGGMAWAATIILDGQTGDWAGQSPALAGAKGDAPPNADLVALWFTHDAANAYFRIDVDVVADGSVPAPPTLALGPIADRSISAGQPWSLRLAANASDPAAVLSYRIDEGPSGAALAPEPLLKWTPGAGDVGASHPFTIAASDGTRSAQASFQVTVTAPENRPPEIEPQPSASIGAGSRFERVIVVSDPDGDAVTLALLGGPPGAALTGNTLRWPATQDDLGEHFFMLQATDARGASSGARFVIQVGPSAVPLAVDDAYQVREGEVLTIAAPGVLANDVNPLGGTLAAEKLSEPDKGDLTAFNSDGAFTYKAPDVLPPPPTFKMELAWHADGRRFAHNLSVGSLTNGDDVPDFVYLSANGIVTARSGDDQRLLWEHNPIALPPGMTLADGTVLPAGRLCTTYSNRHNNPIIADVDDDGAAEVVMAVACNLDGETTGAGRHMRVIALEGATGDVKWLSPRTAQLDSVRGMVISGTQDVNLSVARLSSTGDPLIFGGRAEQGYIPYSTTSVCSLLGGAVDDLYCRRVFAINGKTGELQHNFYAVPPGPGTLNGYARNGGGQDFFGPPVVADLDDDGEVEVLFEGTLWNKNGTVRRHYDGTSAHVATGPFAVADLDGDGKPELILVDYVGERMRGLRLDGSSLWNVPVPECSSRQRCGLSVADVDGDNTPEILVHAFPDRLMVLDALGRLRWARRYSSTLHISGQPAVYDLDGDGVPEVVLRVADTIQVLRGDTGADLDSYQMAPDSLSIYNYYMLPPRVVDIDGDGHAEIVVNNTVPLPQDGTGGVWAFRSANEPWMKVRKRQGARFDLDGNVEELTGQVAAVPPTPGMNGSANLYGHQPQLQTRADLRQRARTSFHYRAQAAGVPTEQATVTIDIQPPNSPPRITSTPPSAAVTENVLAYQITAVDADPGDTITYRLVYSDEPSAAVTPDGLFTRQGRAGYGPFLNIVRATDSREAYSEQSFVINFVSRSGAYQVMPDFEGQTRHDALDAIASSVYSLGRIDEVFDDSVAVGRVISQSPAAGSSQIRGTAVHLTISKGGAPRAVPNLIGAQAASAAGLLPAPFALGSVNYVYSDAVERGRIISQNPLAGTVMAPGAVSVQVSGGSGLELVLSHDYSSADLPIAFTAQAFAPDGSAQPLPGPIVYSVTALMTPHAGPLPSVSGGQISFGGATRGSFRLSASGGGRHASVDFAVGPPGVGGDESPMVEFVQLTQTLQGIQDLLQQARGQDETTARATLAQAVALWRSFDRDALRLSSPMTIEDGFLPTLADLSAAGVAPGPQDALNKQLLRQSIAPLKALTEGLRARHTPLTQIDALGAAFDAKARLVAGMAPSEYGTVLAAPEYALIVSHAIPDMMDALMNDLAEGLGMGREARPFPLLKSALVDTLATLAVEQTIAKVAPLIESAKKYAKDILGQAAWGAAVVALADHAREFLDGQELIAVGSGASMSIHVFESSLSFIEAIGLEWEYTELNTVILIGPDMVSATKDVFDKISGAWSAKPGSSYKSSSEVKKDLKALKGALKSLLDSADAAADTVERAFQGTDEESEDCLFSNHPECTMLLFSDGFDSVYHYSGPGGGTGLGGLPVPIPFIVRNNVSGQIYISTPVFLPTPAP